MSRSLLHSAAWPANASKTKWHRFWFNRQERARTRERLDQEDYDAARWRQVDARAAVYEAERGWYGWDWVLGQASRRGRAK